MRNVALPASGVRTSRSFLGNGGRSARGGRSPRSGRAARSNRSGFANRSVAACTSRSNARFFASNFGGSISSGTSPRAIFASAVAISIAGTFISRS